jgi:hypothetical protein
VDRETNRRSRFSAQSLQHETSEFDAMGDCPCLQVPGNVSLSVALNGIPPRSHWVVPTTSLTLCFSLDLSAFATHVERAKATSKKAESTFVMDWASYRHATDDSR